MRQSVTICGVILPWHSTHEAELGPDFFSAAAPAREMTATITATASQSPLGLFSKVFIQFTLLSVSLVSLTGRQDTILTRGSFDRSQYFSEWIRETEYRTLIADDDRLRRT
jgi:hypothetical protein